MQRLRQSVWVRWHSHTMLLQACRSPALRCLAQVSTTASASPAHSVSSTTTHRQFTQSTAATSNAPTALIWGGNGVLGKSMVQAYSKAGWKTISVDYGHNTEATQNISLKGREDSEWGTASKAVLHELSDVKLSSVIVTAGGWAGGKISDEDELFDSVEQMYRVNVQSAISAGYIASQLLRPHGLIVMTGSSVVYRAGTPTMIAYGVTKAAIHHLIRSLATEDGNGLPIGTATVGLLPVTLDTPNNRQFMGAENAVNWTRPAFVADLTVAWSQSQLQRHDQQAGVENQTSHLQPAPVGSTIQPYVQPINGSFYEFITQNGQTQINVIQPDR